MVTAEMLQGITTAVTGNITAILPTGLAIMAALIGVGMIPRIVYKFL
ncbi:Uncharacterised protein [[Clostridium] sordellii]|nr:hypothetical protein [Paeniclostridium sordellii]CEP50770.1 Uncharacterised protein [[Clostridium] sordellii] [Paeniclostridium sordellii]